MARPLITHWETDFEPLWAALTTNEQTRVLNLLIERIEYSGGDGKLDIAFHATGIRAFADEREEVAA